MELRKKKIKQRKKIKLEVYLEVMRRDGAVAIRRMVCVVERTKKARKMDA